MHKEYTLSHENEQRNEAGGPWAKAVAELFPPVCVGEGPDQNATQNTGPWPLANFPFFFNISTIDQGDGDKKLRRAGQEIRPIMAL